MPRRWLPACRTGPGWRRWRWRCGILPSDISPMAIPTPPFQGRRDTRPRAGEGRGTASHIPTAPNPPAAETSWKPPDRASPPATTWRGQHGSSRSSDGHHHDCRTAPTSPATPTICSEETPTDRAATLLGFPVCLVGDGISQPRRRAHCLNPRDQETKKSPVGVDTGSDCAVRRTPRATSAQHT